MAGPGPARGTISIEIAARLLMLTPQRVHQLVRDGWIAKSGRNAYALPAVVQGYIRFLKSSSDAAAAEPAALDNPRHERFCLEIAGGHSAGEAYRLAGYRAAPGNSTDAAASRLLNQVKMRERIAQLRQSGVAAEKVTSASLLRELAADRQRARQRGHTAAAIAATRAMAQIAGVLERKPAKPQSDARAPVDDWSFLDVDDGESKSVN